MTVLLLACLCGVAAGRLTGGRVRNLAAIRLRALGLVGAAVGLQLGARLAPKPARLALIVASYALIGVWVAANRRNALPAMRVGLGLVAAGWLLNTIAILPNGGMPVSSVALRGVRAPTGVQVDGRQLSKHVVATGRSAAAVLGDVIPVRPLGLVVSAGDLVLFLGLAVCVAAATNATEGAPGDERRAGTAAVGGQHCVAGQDWVAGQHSVGGAG